MCTPKGPIVSRNTEMKGWMPKQNTGGKILSIKCIKRHKWTLLEAKQITNKVSYISTFIQEEYEPKVSHCERETVSRILYPAKSSKWKDKRKYSEACNTQKIKLPSSKLNLQTKTTWL